MIHPWGHRAFDLLGSFLVRAAVDVVGNHKIKLLTRQRHSNYNYKSIKDRFIALLLQTKSPLE